MTDDPGIRAELAVEGAACPVAAASRAADGAVEDVRWTRGAGDRATERAWLPPEADPGALVDDGDGEPGGEGAAAGDPGDATVLAGDEGRLVEFERERADCVCERVEGLGCPVGDVRAEGGTLYVAVEVRTADRLRDVVEAVAGDADRVRLTYVVRGGRSGDGGDPVVVDRTRLTDRQREVLAAAHRRGYFEHPREANAAEVADALGIASSTFREHLAAAQARLLDQLFDREYGRD
ncbi:helix-turn-helix domain-containing protein [Halobaculum sp. EA56]|uniref:helix-turn-helix domain-containing protein n=1 Tax=Halobaculum sp. EA56 TaxID=3421648 RepID=UPI003EBD704F